MLIVFISNKIPAGSFCPSSMIFIHNGHQGDLDRALNFAEKNNSTVFTNYDSNMNDMKAEKFRRYCEEYVAECLGEGLNSSIQ